MVFRMDPYSEIGPAERAGEGIDERHTRKRARKQDLVVQLSVIKRSEWIGVIEKSKQSSVVPYGGIAQLGEHLPCKQGVKGSIPFISTTGCAGFSSG